MEAGNKSTNTKIEIKQARTEYSSRTRNRGASLLTPAEKGNNRDPKTYRETVASGRSAGTAHAVHLNLSMVTGIKTGGLPGGLMHHAQLRQAAPQQMMTNKQKCC